MAKTRRKKRKKITIGRTRLLGISPEYFDAIDVSLPIFPPLFQFENGLRLAVYNFLTTCYGENWWDDSLKERLKEIYNHVESQRTKNNRMPWIGDSPRVSVLPIHLITLGQLEEIVKHYKSDCIPELFPTIDFFTGHMEVIKRVRNLFSHMHPCITSNDVKVARREIITLCEHLRGKNLTNPNLANLTPIT